MDKYTSDATYCDNAPTVAQDDMQALLDDYKDVCNLYYYNDDPPIPVTVDEAEDEDDSASAADDLPILII